VGKISRQAGFAVLAAGKFEIGCTHCSNPASTSSGSETKGPEESDNLPEPDVLAQEIVEDLEAALEQFREIAADLSSEGMGARKSQLKYRSEQKQ
jgi:hypothetical protein